MPVRRRAASLTLLGVVASLAVIGLVPAANAEVLAGACTGSVTFSDGTTITEQTPLSPVVVVPGEDTISYEGSINKPAPSDPVPFSGAVSASTALRGFPIADWSGETIEVSDSGEYTYEVPSWVPRGVRVTVVATHSQLGQTCTVSIAVKLAGSPGTAAIISATGTAVFALAMIGAGVKKKVA